MALIWFTNGTYQTFINIRICIFGKQLYLVYFNHSELEVRGPALVIKRDPGDFDKINRRREYKTARWCFVFATLRLQFADTIGKDQGFLISHAGIFLEFPVNWTHTGYIHIEFLKSRKYLGRFDVCFM